MLPKVVVHNAISADGRMDWLIPDIGLYYELASHWQEDATLAGADTIISAEEDIPEEGEDVFVAPGKGEGDRRPLLVIPDSRGRVRSWHWLRAQPYWRGFVALVSASTPREYLDYLGARHVDYIVSGENKVDLRTALAELNARYNVGVVRVDSGGTLNGALFRAGLVDEVSLLIHPSLVGGMSARSFYLAPDLTSPEDVIPLRLTHLEKVGEDIAWLRYEVVRQA